MSGGTIAIVPIRSLNGGKTRLAGAVDAEARTELTRLMLANVLRSLGETTGIEQILVVSSDPEAHRFASQILPTVETLLQPVDVPGLLPALEVGRLHALVSRAEALLIVFGDLPRLGPADLRSLLDDPAEIVIAPDRARVGTNALLLRGPAIAAFPFRFGEDSFPAHRAEAVALGLEASVVERPGLGFDLDKPGDLALLPTAMATNARWMVAS